MALLMSGSVINRLVLSCLNRPIGTRLVFATHAKAFHSVSKTSSTAQPLLVGFESQPLKSFFRSQFDFSKKPQQPIERRSKWFSGKRSLPKTSKERNLTTLLYLVSLAVLTTGAAYAAVPLYRIFCQVQSFLVFTLFEFPCFDPRYIQKSPLKCFFANLYTLFKSGRTFTLTASLTKPCNPVPRLCKLWKS